MPEAKKRSKVFYDPDYCSEIPGFSITLEGDRIQSHAGEIVLVHRCNLAEEGFGCRRTNRKCSRSDVRPKKGTFGE